MADANLAVKNAAGETVYLKESGAGSDGDPHVPHHVVDSGTVTVQDGGESLTVDGALTASGPAAHDAAASGNPLLAGGYAVNALPAAVANGDVAHLITDLQGRLIVLPLSNPENALTGNPAALTDNAAHDVIAAQGAGVKIYVTSLLVTNSHASVGTLVTIQDDTAGTPIVICQGYAAAGGGGFAITFPVPRGTGANQKLQAICGTTGANVYVSAGGFKAA